jgi:acid phosphatase type 7
MHLPLNGPTPPQPMPLGGNPERLEKFRALAGARWSRMANYSFDYGDAHFTCLDSNVYVDPTSTSLWQWIENDLRSTDALWKFVVYHHPAYNIGKEHYAEQHMRVLSPLFEACGVDMVLTGHEHSYQRPRPFKFGPRDISLASKVSTSKRYVPGHFDIDDRFDGDKNNKPDNPAKWTYEQDNNVNYLTKFVSDRHSLTVFDIQDRLLTMAQIDSGGQEIDRITISKA